MEKLPDPIIAQVSLAKSASLADLEGLVRNAQDIEAQVGLGQVALTLIHTGKLYKETHSSFEAYALETFGIAESSAHRWLKVGKWLLDEAVAKRPLRRPPSQRSLDKPAGQRLPRAGASGDDDTSPSEPIPARSEEKPEAESESEGVAESAWVAALRGARAVEESLPPEVVYSAPEPPIKDVFARLLQLDPEALTNIRDAQTPDNKARIAKWLRKTADFFDPPAKASKPPKADKPKGRTDVQTRFKKRDAPAEKAAK